MVKYKNIIFAVLIGLFLFFSFYPTIFELQYKDKLADKRREFILEHNYYWPDYNLYLSKIKQGIQGHLTAVEKYTSEIHQGSFIQEFYLGLGWLGRVLNLDPNSSYLLGRIILSPMLLITIFLLVKYYFKSLPWQILAFLVTITSGSFPRIFTDSAGVTHVGRYMEWWSNIDALQRITFIPHILFAQIVSFYLLYNLTLNIQHLTYKRLLIYIILGNAVGLTFPPSLITLITVLLITLILKRGGAREGLPNVASQGSSNQYTTFNTGGLKQSLGNLSGRTIKLIFIIFNLPSLLYIFLITKHLPWSALVEFHRTHPMMIPFDQYILGTGPIFFLGIIGAVISIIKRDKKFQPLIFWVLATFSFAAIFSVVKDQSPLRFTQTGLFIPLGLLGTYFFYQVWQFIRQVCGETMLFEHAHGLKHHESAGWRMSGASLGGAQKSHGRPQQTSENNYQIATAAFIIIISFYLLGSLFMMKTSLDWQTTWISQRIGANIPPVPYPPQTMYPLREWMDGIRWLRNNTENNNVVLAEITAANHIPAYSGNTVYWGQSNTVDYDRKEKEVHAFFSGQMSPTQAQLFLKNGKIKYIFFSIQEKEKAGGKNLENIYSFVKPIYLNTIVIIYSIYE
ncbi:hypothetical protein HY029_02925 [Candidatus Gottesmanbacteria bacterium]|nr:hypothetical protein [Candidatus Gottesmanbacteria bacterium]